MSGLGFADSPVRGPHACPIWATSVPKQGLALWRRCRASHIDEAEEGTWHWVTPIGHSYRLDPTILDTTRLLDSDGAREQPSTEQAPGREDPPDDHDPPPYSDSVI